ncbi:MAG: tRNA-dihydrouridine synthase, partial [Nitrospira sp.]|nr:tRNA-dihydrouridine synthase [Nitrospira sp.]
MEHAKQFVETFGDKQFYRMRKHLGWYCKGFPHAASLRAQMVRVSSVGELQSVLDAFLKRPPTIEDLPHDESADDASMLASRCS